ncbi:class I SAM-dependent methyltransferase [Methylobacterium sp. J-088]|uniref:class I SAM-dependent methyltransferase n=1 Tax=Methylobacterium sp. J-088 TaxID=2836664 RepID=UPI001FBA8D71|nr:class I SAM-dependent methyltransferase [Methylobacterium sp. J-088]MCJ2066260.1 class I SAM-dependent methyltransferase [Methylobacterium sp. J-088]
MAVRVPGVRLALVLLADGKLSRRSSARHPFDVEYGVETSGYIPGYALTPQASNGYLAAQPSALRRTFSLLPDVENLHLIDLGCGKGRAILVASEFGFRSITGIEYNPILADIARQNIRHYSQRAQASRQPVVITKDATIFEPPKGPIAIFMYNPFPADLMQKVIKNLEMSLAQDPRDLFLILLNPVAAPMIDGSPALERYFAEQMRYSSDEAAYGSDPDDTVVIWRNRGNRHPRPASDYQAAVTVLSSMRAVLH